MSYGMPGFVVPHGKYPAGYHFTEAHAKASTKKLDMGKSCLRYKKPEDIPLKLIGELSSKLTPDEWIDLYDEAFKKSRKK